MARRRQAGGAKQRLCVSTTVPTSSACIPCNRKRSLTVDTSASVAIGCNDITALAASNAKSRMSIRFWLCTTDCVDLDPSTRHHPVEDRVEVRVWCIFIAQTDEICTAAREPSCDACAIHTYSGTIRTSTMHFRGVLSGCSCCDVATNLLPIAYT
jgi:hypothetical protein